MEDPLLPEEASQPSAAAADDALQPARPAGGMAAAAALEAFPRLIISGESPGEDIGDPSEGEVFFTSPSGELRAVSIPLPKADGNAHAAITDYLNVTFPLPDNAQSISSFFQGFQLASNGFFGGMKSRRWGKYRYARSYGFDRGQVLFAIGEPHGTALLSIPGEGCAFIGDWPKLIGFLRDDLGGRITRWDGAVDDFAGVHSVDEAADLFLKGAFNNGGRHAKCKQVGNWLKPDGSGRSFYVGKRENGKMLRVYEKGKHLGDPASPWVRWELELHNKDRIIPWGVLTEPGRYVAGAYPATGWVQAETSRIRTVKAQDAITYGRMVAVGSNSLGPLVNVMMEREGDAERVVELLRRPGAPRRLAFSNDFLRTFDVSPGHEDPHAP